MDFHFSAEEEAYRSEVRAWLGANLPAWSHASANTEVSLEQRRAWHRQLYEAGYVGATWPQAYGGRARTPVAHAHHHEQHARPTAHPPHPPAQVQPR